MACLVAAGACLLLAVAAPSPAQEQDTVPPARGVPRQGVLVQVMSVQVDRKALIPVPELFRFIALDGAGTYESSTRQARASLLFPGNGLILGPSLACGTFGAQFPGPVQADPRHLPPVQVPAHGLRRRLRAGRCHERLAGPRRAE